MGKNEIKLATCPDCKETYDLAEGHDCSVKQTQPHVDGRKDYPSK